MHVCHPITRKHQFVIIIVIIFESVLAHHLYVKSSVGFLGFINSWSCGLGYVLYTKLIVDQTLVSEGHLQPCYRSYGSILKGTFPANDSTRQSSINQQLSDRSLEWIIMAKVTCTQYLTFGLYLYLDCTGVWTHLMLRLP